MCGRCGTEPSKTVRQNSRKGARVPRREKINAWDATLTLGDHGAHDGAVALVLHGEEGPQTIVPLARTLSACWRVLTPQHPGFDCADRIRGVDRPHEIAYLYLDLLDQLGVGTCVLVGSSLGAWIGMEMAVMQPRRFSRVALLGPIGIKVGGRLDRDFAEVLVAAPDAIRATLYHDAACDPWAGRTGPDDVVARAEQREALLHYTWEPYMHNPKLSSLLSRITAPTLIAYGAQDTFATPGYYPRLAKHFAAAELRSIDGAGHFPEIERPDRTADAVREFLRENA
jgi:pimeloyl-ACP methyl ester carboxylesterase